MTRARAAGLVVAAACAVGCGSVSQQPDAATDGAAGVDAAQDAARIDAPPAVLSYDVAYANAYSTTANFSVTGVLVVINTGTVDLDLGTTQVRSTTDDDPNIVVALTNTTAVATVLLQDQAAGSVASAANAVLALVPENRVDTAYQFRLGATNVPAGFTGTVNATATLQIGGGEIMLPFVIQVRQGGTTVDGAIRVSTP